MHALHVAAQPRGSCLAPRQGEGAVHAGARAGGRAPHLLRQLDGLDGALDHLDDVTKLGRGEAGARGGGAGAAGPSLRRLSPAPARAPPPRARRPRRAAAGGAAAERQAARHAERPAPFQPLPLYPPLPHTRARTLLCSTSLRACLAMSVASTAYTCAAPGAGQRGGRTLPAACAPCFGAASQSPARPRRASAAVLAPVHHTAPAPPSAASPPARQPHAPGSPGRLKQLAAACDRPASCAPHLLGAGLGCKDGQDAAARAHVKHHLWRDAGDAATRATQW